MNSQSSHAPVISPRQVPAFAPLISFEPITLGQLNTCLAAWGHRMGPLARGTQGAWCHGLRHYGELVAVTAASYLMAERVAGYTRAEAVELSRLCACRAGLCRVALRLWREFVFPALPFQVAVSYQDADLHTGATYRFDGWRRVAYSHSGVDTRSGRAGRNKWIWGWPPSPMIAEAFTAEELRP